MSFSFFKQRLIRIVTRPPEFLFAVSRNWVLILLCLGTGAVLSWALVVSKPLIYEGFVKLLITRPDPIDLPTVPQSPRAGLRPTAQDLKRFLVSQADILWSDMVLGKLLALLEAQGVRWELEGLGSQPTGLRKTLSSLWKGSRDLLGFQDPTATDLGREGQIHKAILDFKERSRVELQPDSNTIELRVYGSDRERLKKELRSWIDAYAVRAEEITQQSVEGFLKSLLKHYEEVENAALKELERFQESGPEVSNWNLDDLTQYIAQLQLHVYDLRRRVELGDLAPSLPTGTPPDPQTDQYARELARLELALFETLAMYKEDSPEVERLRGKIKTVKEQLGALGSSEDGLPQKRRVKLEEQLQERSKELQGLLVVKGKLNTLNELESKHKDARDKRQNFEYSLDLFKSQTSIRIQETAGPTVPIRPFNYRPVAKTALGLLCGLLIGVVIAVLRETVRGRVRLKHDVIDDLGLPVVSVFPK